MKILLHALAVLASFALSLTARAQYQVYAGGTTSTDGTGGSSAAAYMDNRDLANPASSARFRAAGGKYYCHSLGWSLSSTPIRNGIYSRFGGKDFILESAVGTNDYLTPADDMQRLFKGPGYWSSARYIVINFVDRWSDPSYPNLLKSSLHPYNTSTFSPIYSPNGEPHPELYPWATDPKFAIRRNTAILGGTMCTDAPPEFYFSRNANYRQYVADEIRWANDNGLVSIVIIFPQNYSGTQFYQKTGEYLEDLAKRGAFPQILAFNCYNSSVSQGLPIGSENDIDTMMYTARVFAERAILVGKTITLKAYSNGKYVSANLVDPNVPLIASQSTAGDGEKFLVIDAGKGQIALKATANDLFVSSGGGQTTMKADKASIGNTEKFRVRLNADATISLLDSSSNLYVTTPTAGADPLKCDKTTVGSSEKFTVDAGPLNPLPVDPAPLSVTINTPAANANLVQGNNLTVNTSAIGGTISHFNLSVNGVTMHQENGAPYDWSPTSDVALGDLAAGLYDISAAAISSSGNHGKTTRQIAVGLADGSGLALTEIGPLIEHFKVRATGPGAYSVQAAGTDLWGASDQGGIVTKPLSGDAVAVVNVESLANIDPFSKAGLTFRDSLDPAAANVALVVTAANGLRFQIRPTSGAASTSTAGTGISAPVWLRLSRQGNVFTAAYSTNGTTWTSAGTKTATLAATAPVGLAVTSHDDTQSTTATFSDLRLKSANSLPGWRALIFSPADLSNPAISGDDADPDHDGLTNFHEFVTDLNPHLDDRNLNRVKGTKNDLPSFRLQFRQRKDLGGVTRVFQHSINLTDWPSVSPTSIELLQDLGNAATYEASFPFVGEAAFFRVRYEP
ncbi:hypothetical protein OKA05_24405 [Luteolibacter arcticus]|uniref:DUF1349 domain-containing protein n=1 Tax=Luteolibacter arcticus TaxID=1581411 RepID=A0ABT3GQB6_9BACT|nr:Ig-like domain-containing protein [Luteolibacter arcticus]MCW1925722.1 hypothetical protein [Luteolibacter arcticus]